MEISLSGRGLAGPTLDFLLCAKRDAEAAKRFFRKTLHASHTTTPRVINVDKNAAYPKAVAELKAEGLLPDAEPLRQNKYLNQIVEQDHRFIKRLTNPGLGFASFRTAWRTLRGYEIMNMIRKGQLQGAAKSDVLAQNTSWLKSLGLVCKEVIDQGKLQP